MDVDVATGTTDHGDHTSTGDAMGVEAAVPRVAKKKKNNKKYNKKCGAQIRREAKKRRSQGAAAEGTGDQGQGD